MAEEDATRPPQCPGPPGPRVCLPVMLGAKTEITARGDQPDPGDWKKMSAVHCQSTQSVLTFLCGLDGRSGKVKFEKFEKFQQPCEIQAAAYWEAAESGRLVSGSTRLS